MLSRCFFDFSVGVKSLVIGLSPISSFFSLVYTRNFHQSGDFDSLSPFQSTSYLHFDLKPKTACRNKKKTLNCVTTRFNCFWIVFTLSALFKKVPVKPIVFLLTCELSVPRQQIHVLE